MIVEKEVLVNGYKPFAQTVTAKVEVPDGATEDEATRLIEEGEVEPDFCDVLIIDETSIQYKGEEDE